MGKRIRSLRGKLILALVLALVLALALAWAWEALGNFMIGRWYLAPQSVQGRVQSHLAALRNYTMEESVSSTDVEAMGRFCRERRFCQVIIYGKSTVLTADEKGVSLISSGGLVVNTTPGTDVGNRWAVNFSDGAYSVSITDVSEKQIQFLVTAGGLIVACIGFLLVMLLYNRQLTGQILDLSRQVRKVSQGDLSLEIPSKSRDEIGSLAEDVNALRLSVLDKLQREERAWRANSELITAISHDVRTPLTTLMGYLDILGQQENLPPQELKQYLDICRRKAESLKELTDELFGYFLVLGTPEPEVELEILDGDLLLGQMLGELSGELEQRGFRVEADVPPLEIGLRVDPQHIARIFSNLLSNVCKYGAPEASVRLTAEMVGDLLCISLSNGVKAEAGKVESTKIGLQTCQKLSAAMGGEFRKIQEGGRFTAQLFLPAVKEHE